MSKLKTNSLLDKRLGECTGTLLRRHGLTVRYVKGTSGNALRVAHIVALISHQSAIPPSFLPKKFEGESLLLQHFATNDQPSPAAAATALFSTHPAHQQRPRVQLPQPPPGLRAANLVTQRLFWVMVETRLGSMSKRCLRCLKRQQHKLFDHNFRAEMLFFRAEMLFSRPEIGNLCVA